MKNAVKIFSELGERLAAFGTDAPSYSAIARASAENGWFTPKDICCAVSALRSDMLRQKALEKWLSDYDIPVAEPKRVAAIMAGNIPLVGFFDLMCIIASGHEAVVKPSGKDRILTEYIIGLLREIEPELTIDIIGDNELDSARIDAVIAMGGDNTKRHLKSIFAGKPQLLRGNRHSVAVLSGNETESDIAGLCDDLFMYSGLGCRSVSMIFIPRGLQLHLPAADMGLKYLNNYRQNKALLTMQGERFIDTGTSLLVGSCEFPAAISRVAVAEYDDISEVEKWLADHDHELQCVVSECISHQRRAGFGQAQHPQLTDYPDNADVMAFLTAI